MEKWIDKFLEKFGYIRVKLGDPKKFNFTNRDIIVSTIQKTLTEATQSGNASVDEEFLTDISKLILANLERNSSMSIHDQIRKLHPDMIAERMITYVLACGIACHWETRVKLLAEKLGIRVFSDNVRKNQKSPGYRKLEDIISDIKIKLPKLDLNLTRTERLRDALVHGNFHQLKTYASESQKKNIRDSFGGKVWKVSLNRENSDPVALSEVSELNEIKTHGSFSWFLDTATSSLFETVALEIKKRINELSNLSLLYALSFNETSQAFKHICIDGIPFTRNDIEKFTELRKNQFDSEKSIEKLFSEIHSILKN